MTNLQTVLEIIDRLTAEERQQIVDYITQGANKKKKERILDLHPGSMQMNDDFDDELPDSFWLGEE